LDNVGRGAKNLEKSDKDLDLEKIFSEILGFFLKIIGILKNFFRDFNFTFFEIFFEDFMISSSDLKDSFEIFSSLVAKISSSYFPLDVGVLSKGLSCLVQDQRGIIGDIIHHDLLNLYGRTWCCQKDAAKQLKVTSNIEYTILCSSCDVTFSRLAASFLQQHVRPFRFSRSCIH